MLISTAHAQELAQTTGESASFAGFIPLILVFVIFYFLLIRPQQKKLKDHDMMVNSLKRGEKVITAGGLYGSITKVEDTEGILHLEIAPDVVVKVKRSTIADVISRTEPITQDKKKAKDLKKNA